MLQLHSKERAFFSLDRKPLANLSLSQTEFSVIMGGLLGNGELKMCFPEKNARYFLRHSKRCLKHWDYFYSKCEMLKGIAREKHFFLEKPKKVNSCHPLCRFQSKALEDLTTIHKITHQGNQKVIKRKWLNHLTSHSLAIWWFDHGFLVAGGRQGCIRTDGFTEQECRILSRYLFVVWKIHARVGPVKVQERKGGTRNVDKANTNTSTNTNTVSVPSVLSAPNVARVSYRLWLSTNPLKQLLQIVIPHLSCVSMVSKCLIYYKNDQLQQRWISHFLKICAPEKRGECEKRIVQLLTSHEKQNRLPLFFL